MTMTAFAEENPFLADLCVSYGADRAALSAGVVHMGTTDDAPLQRRLNAIVPLRFAVAGDYVFGSAYPPLRPFLNDYLCTYRGDLFSEQALTALHQALTPWLSEQGYRPSAFYTRYAESCLCTDPAVLPHHLVRADCVRLEESLLPHLKSLVSMKPADCVRRGAYGCIINGKLCAVASVNDCSGAVFCREIGVECAPGYRGQGMAVSCVTALAKELLFEGFPVLYQYHQTNTASCAVARKAGFVPVGKFFTYTAFRA